MTHQVSPDMNAANAHYRGPGTRLLEVVCAGLLACMVILLFIQVVSRYGLHNPPDWTEELARTVFVYLTFVGGALAVARNAHLKVDSAVKLLPDNVQPWIRLLTNLIAIVFLGYVLYYSSIMLPRLAFQPLTALPFLSKAWFFAAVPVGCSLMLLYELHRLMVEVRGLMNKPVALRS
ncbi:MAG: TRAP transporter small permease [Rhodoferax sp.]|nr:TRAP transporter small permease [Rhodoferax sp.]